MSQVNCTGCPVLGNELFQALPTEVRDRAICLFRPAELKAGTPLYLEGFPAHSIFAIRRGTCKAVRTMSNGREQVLRSHSDGDFVGFDALMLDQYPHTVQTTTDATVCHAPRAVFVDTVVNAPAFATAVIRHLSDELRQIRGEMASLGTQGALARVARHLSGAQQRNGVENGAAFVVLPLNRRDTAGMLGMAEESLSRQLAALEQMGVVRRRGRRLLIEDSATLEQLAGV